MSETSQQELQHFIAKWLAREPEMQFAEVFCPASEKSSFLAWGALLHELKHTLFELSDARVTEVKTAWWADELLRLAKAQPRHPITQALVDAELPWPALSSSLFGVIETASIRASNTAHALENLLPFASAVVAIEDGLFASKVPALNTLFAVHCLLQRLPQGLAHEDRARIPMHLLARYSINAGQLADIGMTGLLQDWGRELAGISVQNISGSLFRRARTRFDNAQLAALIQGKGLAKASAPQHLWRAWRAAVVK